MAIKFEVLAINPKTGSPGLLGRAETQQAAEDLRDQATRAGWLLGDDR
jgi:4-hydroxy-L-threonine phosphate dehydrogenase PdxA